MADPERNSARRNNSRAKSPAHFPVKDGRRRLTREKIVDTAIELVDHDGVRQLNMRRLGNACGVEAMALYRYVEGRDDLLNKIVDRLVDTLHATHLRHRSDEDGWQDYLVSLAEDVRRVALDHPDLFPLIATVPSEAPWIRPPLRSLRWLDTFLDTLISYDFDDESAAAAYRLYTTFLIGHLLLEVSGTEARAEPRADSALNLSRYAHLQRLQELLSRDVASDEFDESLERLLERIETIAPPSDPE